MFGSTSAFSTTASTNTNAMKDVEVQSPPDDSVSCIKFSPTSTGTSSFLIAGSWDNNVRCWEVTQQGQTIPKAQQTHTGPVLDCDWSEDGTKVFTASVDKTVKMWDLNSNQAVQVAQHDAPIKTVHWIKAPNYSCIMTGGWDKLLKFWDTRSPTTHGHNTVTREMLLCRCSLSNGCEFSRIESPLKFQHRCISIFLDKKINSPTGFALGSIEGRVAIHYVNPTNPKDNFTFKCHRSNGATNGMQDIYAVNDISFHPIHGTLATVGSDCKFSFWDKDARTKLKTSELFDQPITACNFNSQGTVFAYATSYDWSKGHEGFDPQKKPHIFLRSCFDELKPSMKKS
ncbi:GLE2 [Mytilus edulis]|uniref:RAE1 n=1 Tax=Mytilus edulis TaxID=6550 RepID=A0A8S3VPQ3_MYTED|nr:GLE2 [Mytilus edulis]